MLLNQPAIGIKTNTYILSCSSLRLDEGRCVGGWKQPQAGGTVPNFILFNLSFHLFPFLVCLLDSLPTGLTMTVVENTLEARLPWPLCHHGWLGIWWHAVPSGRVAPAHLAGGCLSYWLGRLRTNSPPPAASPLPAGVYSLALLTFTTYLHCYTSVTHCFMMLATCTGMSWQLLVFSF